MKRYAVWLALVSIGLSPLAVSGSALAASAEAKKFCSDQWDAEKKSNTVPRGMTREKYMRQCTTNYTANHTATDTTQTPPVTTPPSNSEATWPPTTPAAPSSQATTPAPAH